MAKLTVSMAQMAVESGRIDENLRKAERFIADAKRRSSELVCFPELWTTGLSWPEHGRGASDYAKAIETVGDMARRHGVWINGSMVEPREGLKPSNTSILFDPRGARVAAYRKTHLFKLLDEHEHFSAGDSLCTAETPWGIAGFSVCYDIRFPELFGAYAVKGAKLVLSPAAFPSPRAEHWKMLIRARAIEDQFFMIGTNRVGSEKIAGRGTVTFCGLSAIIDPWGETVIEGSAAKEELLTATIDTGRVEEVRSNMSVLKDRRPDLYSR